ncbi:MAG: hypothetical protein KAT68_02345 [Bacteroidales bacterium]|nr:hypothetical protein [Bacteroidales bacterium]
MDSTISRIITIISIVLMGVSALLGLLFYIGVITEEPFIIWAYILVGTGAIAILVFSVMNIFSNKKAAKGSLIGLLFVAVLLFISYLLASDEILIFMGSEQFFEEGGAISPNTFSKLVGTGIYSMYVLFVLAFASAIYVEIASFFK